MLEISPKEAEAGGRKGLHSSSEEILELMLRIIKSKMEKMFERLEDILGYELEDPEVQREASKIEAKVIRRRQNISQSEIK